MTTFKERNVNKIKYAYWEYSQIPNDIYIYKYIFLNGAFLEGAKPGEPAERTEQAPVTSRSSLISMDLKGADSVKCLKKQC